MSRPPAVLAFTVDVARLLAGSCLILCCIQHGDAAAPVQPTRPPNIILIVADDLGYGDLGCYGQRLIATPQLDTMAAEGTRFTQFYAGASVCAPSRCVLMTGLHTGHALFRENHPDRGGTPEQYGDQRQRRLSLRSDDITLAEVLRARGYRTGLAGKWGLAEPGSEGVPTRQGFDQWLGYLNNNHAAEHFTDFLWRNEERQLIEQNLAGRRELYVQDLFTDFALRFVGRQPERPFFLYLAYALPHANFEAPDLGPHAGRAWPEPAKAYAAMISRLDADVGQLQRRLKQLGLEEQTVVLFTSDNGPAVKDASWNELFNSCGPLRGAKGSLYEGGVRVPMIVRWPGRVLGGRTSDEPWSFVDVMPTLAELARSSAPDRADGRSAVALLSGKPDSGPERRLYWEQPRQGRLEQAVRAGPWKCIRAGAPARVELYNLNDDPRERADVAAEQPAVVQTLVAYMESQHVDSPHWPATIAK